MRTDLVQTLMIVGVTSSTIGCDSGLISMDSGGSDELGDESSQTEDTGEAGETGETGDTGEEGSTCMTAEGTLGVAALRLDSSTNRAWVIAGGSELELALTGPADDSTWLVGAGADAGQRIAIARTTGEFGQDQHATIHAFDRSSGALDWARELAAVGVSQLWVADDGWIAGTTNVSTPGQTVGFAMNDDQAIELTDHRPLAAPSGGTVVVQEVLPDLSAGLLGWITLADQSWTPLQLPASQNYGVRVDEDDRTLEYMAAGAVFVRASPDAYATFELPSEQLPSDTITLADAAGRFRLLQASDPVDFTNVAVRVDVESGEVIVVDPEPPAGWSWFDCYMRNARIDADGAVLFELRDSASARVWAFQPDDAQWSEVGLAVGLVDDIDFAGDFGAVHVVHSAAQFMTYCPSTSWTEPPPEALVGDSMQLVRRSPALALALPTAGWGGVEVDDGERCVAYVNADGWWVRALEGDAELSFGPSGTWQWLD